MKRRRHPGQFDLFAPTSDPVAEPGPAAEAPARALADTPSDRLLDDLALHAYGVPPAAPALAPLAAELAERGEQRAGALLLRACRRCLAAGGTAPAAELTALLDALTALGGAEIGQGLTDLVERGEGTATAQAAVVDRLLALRHRPATLLLPRLAGSGEPRLRQAACRLAGELGGAADRAVLAPLVEDADRAVARAACLALGRLGDSAVKAELEALLVRAAPLDLPVVLAALQPVADDDTAAVLARVAERSDESGRLAIVDALGGLGCAGAVAGLLRLARDTKPAVRAAVVAALSDREPDDRVAAALGALAQDRDAAVRAAAEEALKAYEPGW